MKDVLGIHYPHITSTVRGGDGCWVAPRSFEVDALRIALEAERAYSKRLNELLRLWLGLWVASMVTAAVGIVWAL